ncbi:MAG: glycerol-3-phosphate 1-O-acyltransferase PlsY [Pseudomonadota bacterium]|nr:glycerol-3-phosphate 1-O-acyltransferase PlsY [Pseudomonadota bacterium]
MGAGIFTVIAYLLGSVNTAIIICQLMKLPDPRTEGSKNPGATNVMRVAGRNAAIIVLVMDILKGFIVVLVAKAFGITGFGLGLVAFGATLGHVFPAFYGFQGGKGVATAIGGILGLNIWVGVIAALVWIITAAITRLASLSSLVAIILANIFILFVNPGFFIPVLGITVLVTWRHRENITRIRAGTESQMDFSRLK